MEHMDHWFRPRREKEAGLSPALARCVPVREGFAGFARENVDGGGGTVARADDRLAAARADERKLRDSSPEVHRPHFMR